MLAVTQVSPIWLRSSQLLHPPHPQTPMMRSFVLPSTFFLTLLLMVGLFFFIRASVKDRTEESQWLSTQSEEAVLKQVEAYLTNRAYRLISLDKEQEQVIFEGVVRPSLVLASFLTGLMLTATLCLSLVLSIQFPSIGLGFTVLTLISPVAGWFYWQKARTSRARQIESRVCGFSNIRRSNAINCHCSSR